MTLIAKVTLNITLIPDFEEDSPEEIDAYLRNDLQPYAAQYGSVEMEVEVSKKPARKAAAKPKVKTHAKRTA